MTWDEYLADWTRRCWDESEREVHARGRAACELRDAITSGQRPGGVLLTADRLNELAVVASETLRERAKVRQEAWEVMETGMGRLVVGESTCEADTDPGVVSWDEWVGLQEWPRGIPGEAGA